MFNYYFTCFYFFFFIFINWYFNTIALAELTCNGWSNTAGQQRGTLQRVSYALVNDVLKRSYTTSLETPCRARNRRFRICSGA